MNSKSKAALAVAVAAIIAIAAVAAVLNKNGNDSDGIEVTSPGSFYSYDVSGTMTSGGLQMKVSGTMKTTVVANSDEKYYTENTMSFTIKEESMGIEVPANQTWVTENDRKTSTTGEAIKEGTTQMETINGRKNVEIWSESNESWSYKYYIGESDRIPYLIMMDQSDSGSDMKMVITLTSYEVNHQKNFKQSEDVGKKASYSISSADMSGLSGSYTMTYVGDGKGSSCVEYGMKLTMPGYDPSDESGFTVVDDSTGLPQGSVKTGTKTMDTIDGQLTLNIWECLGDDGNVIRYYEHNEVPYIIETSTEGFTLTMTLTGYDA